MSTKNKPTPPTAEQLRAEILSEVTAELERLAGIEQETRDEIGRLDAEHDVKLDRWQAQCVEARVTFRPEPPRPERESTAQMVQLLHRLRDARTAENDRAFEVLGHEKYRVEGAWQEARETLAQRAAEALKPLEALAVEVGDWRRLLADARLADERARGIRALNGAAGRMRTSIAFPDLQALAAGSDVLAPAPLPPKDERYEKAAQAADRQEARALQRQIEVQERNKALGVRRWL